MEATKMVESLRTLREGFEKPVTDLDIIRRALQEKVARASGIEMPPILNAEQRRQFADKLELLHDFLESEDGADAIELLLNTWASFVAGREESSDETDDPKAYHD